MTVRIFIDYDSIAEVTCRRTRWEDDHERRVDEDLEGISCGVF